MRKRSIAALLAALIVVAVGFFASFFLLYADKDGETYTITLPGQGSAVIDPTPEIGESNRVQLQTVQVDRTNIQAVIQKLDRPESYRATIETTYYYGDVWTVLKSQVWQKADRTKLIQFAPDGTQGQQALLTKAWVYTWGGESAPVRFPRQKSDEDLYARASTYEDLLNMPAEAILEGRVTELDGQLCLYAKTRDEMTGEVEQWYVLSENGLLLYADGMLDGVQTYQSRLSELSPDVFDDNLFLLPDGTKPE